MSFRNPCAGQVQLAGSPAVGIRRFVFGGLPAGEECRALAAQAGDVVPGVEAGPVRMQPGDTMHGRIETAGDVDAYGIALQAGMRYVFRLEGAAAGTGTLPDPALAVHGPGLDLQADDAGRGELVFTARSTGVHLLAVRSAGAAATGSFVLVASGVADDLSPTPVLPATAFSGAATATLTGSATGSLAIDVGSDGRIGGTLRLDGAAPIALTGSVTAGGVAVFGGGGHDFETLIGPDGRLAGTWRAGAAGGLLVGSASIPAARPTVLTVRAYGVPLDGVWPQMVLRVNGAVVGSVAVTSSQPADYEFTLPALPPGASVDVVYVNDGYGGSPDRDRNLYIVLLRAGSTTVLPTHPGAIVDWGWDERAFDGLDVVPGQGALWGGGALRLTWPSAEIVDHRDARRQEAARFLQQASFGPTLAEIERVAAIGPAAWIDEQLGLASGPGYVAHVQRAYARGPEFLPRGGKYNGDEPAGWFWQAMAGQPDALRQRVAWSLHQIFVVSQQDSNLFDHARGYAAYLDTLNRHAFGNYRQLLEEIALSPMMGTYLSHIRNRKEDPATGRVPDENFAREVMQLFSIGLVELNPDGTPQLGPDGRPVETYRNADVMGLAKVFTGWGWAFPPAEQDEGSFRWRNPWPAPEGGGDRGIDLQPMVPYAGQHSLSEKLVFAGKPWALRIPPGTEARDSLRLALDTLANHPNVGPFIGRQLIQRLVTSQPSPAYVARVSAVFANDGQGVRGNLGAVVRAILLDPEARQAPAPGFGKLREPVLRVGHWLRAFGATSVSGQWMVGWDLVNVNQRPFSPPSVFSYFRPGYVPPNSALSAVDANAPEFQLLSESTAASWVNLAEAMTGWGIGWTGSESDVRSDLRELTALAAQGRIDAMVERINLHLFAGRMPAGLRARLLDAAGGVDTNSQGDAPLWMARSALFVALTSPDYLIQR
ncbi:hypothetical protein ISF6_4770 [Piscinibacter sakaiensis]|uniref:Carbohydrate binding module xylan-binding domain-containing protein n=2 Tax=Piscinibacter sakaiensis TaxID=1547922 RepID=A0A0K8P6R7_PISS1|nr:hypothetical protein ISF6_4770 [Piscinibacter sakaiensis]